MGTHVKNRINPCGELKPRQASTQNQLLLHYIIRILPKVQILLRHWRQNAQNCKHPQLRAQALASIKTKAFHCQGGAVFAVPYHDYEMVLTRFIVAYQTICDYLDNLCDQVGSTDGRSFYQLHQSLVDALTPDKKPVDYYEYYKYRDDGGYLGRLVDECRQCIKKLPSYKAVQKPIEDLAAHYIHLQAKKHIDLAMREKVLIKWVEAHLDKYPGLMWQEYAAACGSTLGIFALLGLATEKYTSCRAIDSTLKAYFPWICGLHILLDYFIDQAEDRLDGELNFTFYYVNNEEMAARLQFFIAQANDNTKLLSEPTFARTVIKGLLAMYLSDSKVGQQGFKKISTELIKTSGPDAFRVYYLCSVVRKFL